MNAFFIDRNLLLLGILFTVIKVWCELLHTILFLRVPISTKKINSDSALAYTDPAYRYQDT